MTTLALHKRAEREGIEIYDRRLRNSDGLALPQGWIAIDTKQLETDAEYKVVLAHEMGHVETGSFYNVASRFEVRAKCERRADKWAIQKLIPLRKLKRALRSGIGEVWELAEYFDVTEEFIAKAMKLYEGQV